MPCIRPCSKKACSADFSGPNDSAWQQKYMAWMLSRCYRFINFHSVLTCLCRAGAVADRVRDGGMSGGQYRSIPHASLRKVEKNFQIRGPPASINSFSAGWDARVYSYTELAPNISSQEDSPERGNSWGKPISFSWNSTIFRFFCAKNFYIELPYYFPSCLRK